MANVFEKVVWTECTGDLKRDCPKFLNRERQKEYKKTCGECGSRVKEITRPDAVRVGILAAVLLLALGAGGWYVRSRILDRVANAVSDVPSRPSAPFQPASDALNWTLEAERSGTTTRMTPADFDRSENVFTARDSFTIGDRLRVEVSYPSGDRLYAFYRNGGEAKSLYSGGDGHAVLPSADNWFELDDQKGTEEFVLVTSAKPIVELESIAGQFTVAALNSRLDGLGSSVKMVRILVPHR